MEESSARRIKIADAPAVEKRLSGYSLLTDEHCVDLRTKGYTIVRKVLTLAETEACARAIIDRVNKLAPEMRLGAPGVSVREALKNYVLNLHGIVPYFGYIQTLWDLIKMNPNVLNVFREIYGLAEDSEDPSRDLLTSFDRAFVGLPLVTQEKAWLHCDQSSERAQRLSTRVSSRFFYQPPV